MYHVISLLLIIFGTKYVYSAATCEEAYVEGSTSTGVKTLTHNDYNFKAFCVYNDDRTGWFYPSTQAVTSDDIFTLNLDSQYDDDSQFKVRIFFKDGTQTESVIEQISAYANRPLTIVRNTNAGFSGPSNTAHFSPNYLFVGLLEHSLIHTGFEHGWKADGSDILFFNSGETGFSYFAFYPVVEYGTEPYGLGTDYDTTNTWRGSVNNLPVLSSEEAIPSDEVSNFEFTIEIHFGGGGVIELSKDWDEKTTNPLNAESVAIGLKFSMSDECTGNPCGSHGTCNDKVKSYTCTCNTGWTGTACTEDINECGTDDPCVHGSCSNTDGSYSCSCDSGYSGTNCDTDIDECSTDDPCVHGSCSNTDGSYSCTCDDGYYGTNCDADDVCETLPCQNGGTCESTDGDYSCVCSGYQGEHCETDIDECQDSSNCENGQCTNQAGSYTCACDEGYSGDTCSQDLSGVAHQKDGEDEGVSVEHVGIGVAVASAVLIALLVLIICLVYRRKKNKQQQATGNVEDGSSNKQTSQKTVTHRWGTVTTTHGAGHS